MRKDQLGLFDQSAPFVRDSDTSEQAAAAIEPDTSTLRGIVLAFLRGRGAYGATDEEMQLAIPMPPSTQRPRRVELMDAGFVDDSGFRRKTQSGRNAVVWISMTVR